MSKIYISGKITGTDDYMERFERAERLLTDKGYTVINPAKINSNLPPNTSHEQYMNMSYTMLDMADAIFMMNGWRNSVGACMEHGYAVAKKIRIIEEDDMINWFDVR